MSTFFAQVIASVSIKHRKSLALPESDGMCVNSFLSLFATAEFRNSEVLASSFATFGISAEADIIHLIENNPTLFSDTPCRTTVLSHDIDVGDHLPITQHAYCVKPTTRSLLKKEVDYLLKNRLAIPSSSAWSSPCLLALKSDQHHGFVQISER